MVKSNRKPLSELIKKEITIYFVSYSKKKLYWCNPTDPRNTGDLGNFYLILEEKKCYYVVILPLKVPCVWSR